jgi:hypothetical protein
MVDLTVQQWLDRLMAEYVASECVVREPWHGDPAEWRCLDPVEWITTFLWPVEE